MLFLPPLYPIILTTRSYAPERDLDCIEFGDASLVGLRAATSFLPSGVGTNPLAAGLTGLPGNVMSKSDTLRYGPPGESAVHICVDMQRMFAEGTEWKMPWLERVLPNIIAATSAHPERTVFTRQACLFAMDRQRPASAAARCGSR